MIRWLSIIVCLTALISSTSFADNWPHWRGPEHNGVSTATNLPSSWSDTENIRWKVEMPGEGAATPIIWDDQVFVASRNDTTGELLALAYDLNSGKELWRQTVGIDPGDNRRQNMSSPSPATDGERVYFLYGSGDLATFTLDGEKVWARNLVREMGRFAVAFGYASSPLVHDSKLYVQILQRDPESYLIAIDPATGEDLYKHVRETDARQETKENYTSPIPYNNNGRDEIVIFGADYVTGHNPDTGEEFWRWGEYNPRQIGHWRIVPSPVTGGGHVFVAAPKREPLFAIKAGAEGRVGDDYVSWQFESNPPDVCTPAYHDGHLYVLDGDRHIMTKIEAASGDIVWEGQLESRVVMRASPTIADGKIFAHNEEGKIYVMEDGDEFNLLTEIELGGTPMRSSFAFGPDCILVRTSEALYCVAKTESE